MLIKVRFIDKTNCLLMVINMLVNIIFLIKVEVAKISFKFKPKVG